MFPLTELIEQKHQRLKTFEAKQEQLIQQSEKGAKTQLKRNINSTYHIIKYIVIIAIALTLLVAGIFLISKPGTLLEDQNVKTILVNGTKQEYAITTGKTLKEALIILYEDEGQLSIEEITSALNKALDHTIEKQLKKNIVLTGLLLACMALFFMYIARLTRKIFKRNKSLRKKEILFQELISTYKDMIEEENNELKNLQELENKQAYS
ncbi:hypothetical protein SAMN05216480_10695 [Pustulibacterium marinum]|uniref:Uncharacterized protein n=1 Tax=Pustulibacterium marinum TaxID=1224947 RepID=A0A1I7GYC9_9FLAO|nr:hypothetical protein [Pustulibacterium marinum]SFU53441.1 hypothetical protein SAMN05216480_10695 [Pustulibacterium marinum]